jgi:hypothetical protein
VISVSEEDDILTGTLVHVTEYWEKAQSEEKSIAERAESSRTLTDEARLALTQLALPSVSIIGARLLGLPADDNGVAITKDREDTAWEILSRVGVPRLRATAIAASISAATHAPAPDSPGWEPPDEDDDGEAKELDPASYDAQIEAFVAGADAARKLRDG